MLVPKLAPKSSAKSGRWKAAFQRDELIAAHGAACPMPSLLERLAAPGCARTGKQWDRCGVYYVDPVESPAIVPPPQLTRPRSTTCGRWGLRPRRFVSGVEINRPAPLSMVFLVLEFGTERP
jgi:hypothetical protein